MENEIEKLKVEIEKLKLELQIEQAKRQQIPYLPQYPQWPQNQNPNVHWHNGSPCFNNPCYWC
jgi:hypothetical protein